ncbi:trypsin-like serine peptidase [Pseudomonas sp. 18173]|uniref:trypsin-like serine peptidase n=1 Tax=Pseudomonas sp. 18173 TaxID=3390055 RepID=UPI003D1B79BE
MKKTSFVNACSVLLFTLGGLNSAMGKQQDWGEGTPNFSAAQSLKNATGQYDHWQSIGRVEIEGGMTCSGTLIDTRHKPDGLDDPAYVLTAGHCSHLNPDTVLENEVAKGHVSFNYFQDTAEKQKSFPITTINWSTIRGQDVSIIQLDQTLGQLIDQGIVPLKLATRSLSQGSDILIVGSPVGSHVQRMACPQEHSAGVIESMWAWQDQISNRCLDVVSGISGSPVLDRYTNEVVAVVGTTTRGSGHSRCSSGAPCEVINGAISKATDTNYATQTIGIQECFTAGKFNRKNGVCSLGPAFTFDSSLPEQNHIKLERDDAGAVVPWQWTELFSIDQPYYRYKYTRTLADCRTLSGYSDPITSIEGRKNELSQKVESGAGMYLMCIMGQNDKISVPGQWDARNARVYWRWMMEGPNKLAPIYTITQMDEVTYEIRVFPVSPDLNAYQYKYKAGPTNQTNCLDDAEYRPVQGSIGVFEVSVESGQVVVCLKTNDLAGNPSPVADFKLPE